MKNTQTKERVLGRKMSKQELEKIAGGATTPATDGCVDDKGNDTPCP
ncbi:hypothetical protein [Pseudoalteromonas sp. S16_S37]|nr:hypothetical protein [Pseudoalteromonas sp. S16_S37]MBD1585012.1 hypothetical protein [Pseudoalteromonas sp. S16_S37]